MPSDKSEPSSPAEGDDDGTDAEMSKGEDVEAGAEEQDEANDDADGEAVDSDAVDAADDEDDAEAEDEDVEYEAPTERDRTVAGWGCVVLSILCALGTYILYRSAMNKLADLPEAETVARPVEERREPSPVNTVAPGPRVEWDQTIEQAMAGDRPIMLVFCAQWATACSDMEQTTFANARVLEASRAFARVSVDLTQGGDTPARRIANQYEVDGVPQLVFMRPDGRRLRGDTTGLVDARDMLVYMSEALGAYEESPPQ